MSAEEQAQSAPSDARAGYRRPGRPRSAEADRAIVVATINCLAEEGFRGLSVERVAQQAGVSKATIYRRYPTKTDLVIAAVTAAGIPDESEDEPIDTGSIVGDVEALGEELLAANDNDASRLLVLPNLLAESAVKHPELFEAISNAFVEPRQLTFIRTVQRAMDRGELRSDLDPDLIADMIIGTFVIQLLRTGADSERMNPRWIESVRLMVEGLAQGNEREDTDGG